MAAHEESLRRLALHDERCIQSLLGIRLSDHRTAGLGSKTHALVRLAALVALGASCVSYGWAVDAALGAGATADEIVGTLIAVAPITGVAQVVAATPAVACSLGYDLDWAFEVLDATCGTDREGSGTAASGKG
ncbi:MAG TPA: carboxymuconolactone decarboxylase family protein [Actinomycetes bacterium]|jgi:alkylhydroperoxidase/carboxymuconolactone decarboxylase family protein YurZ